MRSKAAAVSLVLTLMACGGTESADGGPAVTEGQRTVRFLAHDLDYVDAPRVVAAGEQMFELVNEGRAAHNIVIEEFDEALVVSARGGATATGAVTLPPGQYTYFCSIPGHRAAGMEGVLEATSEARGSADG